MKVPNWQEEHFRNNSISRIIVDLLVYKEIKLSGSLYNWGRVCSGCTMLCSTSLDQTTTWRFWNSIKICPLFCNNTSAMNMTKNPAQHERIKHINIKHHFLRDNVEKVLVKMVFSKTKDQIIDISPKFSTRTSLKEIVWSWDLWSLTKPPWLGVFFS